MIPANIAKHWLAAPGCGVPWQEAQHRWQCDAGEAWIARTGHVAIVQSTCGLAGHAWRHTCCDERIANVVIPSVLTPPARSPHVWGCNPEYLGHVALVERLATREARAALERRPSETVKAFKARQPTCFTVWHHTSDLGPIVWEIDGAPLQYRGLIMPRYV